MSGVTRTRQQAFGEVIVVENGSVDGSPDALARRTDIILLENERNLGYRGGCEPGVQAIVGRARAPAQLRRRPGRQALQSMMAFLDEHPTIAGVAPLYVFPDGSPQPFHFRFPDVLRDTRQLQRDRSALHSRHHSSIAGVPDARRRFLARSTCASAVGELSAASPIGASRRPRFSTSGIRSSSTTSSLRGRWRRGDESSG